MRTHPTVVLLTPVIYNSAYYEHISLPAKMVIPLVERNLMVDDHKVFMKTTTGLQQVDVIYRRIDVDTPRSIGISSGYAGVPGIECLPERGTVALINAVGNGVADDKAVYAYVPAMIRYYLNEEPIL